MPGASLLARIGYTKSQKKMRTKTINTEVLNNSSLTQALQQHVQEQMVAPPLPPRSPGEAISVLGENSLLVVVTPEDCDNGAGEVSLPGAPSLHTHSSKFPIEREVIVRSGEKQCKIPILADYMRRAKPTVAPDVPQKQLAWTHQIKSVEMAGTSLGSGLNQDIPDHQVYKAVPVLESSCGSEPSPIRPVDSNPGLLDSGPTTSTPEESGRGLSSRTYRSLKEMVTRGFSNQKSGNAAETSLSPQSQLRQAGVYLQPQPAQFRAPQQHQQQQQQPITSSEGYRIYPIGNYTETPRRTDVAKSQSHDSLLSQDNRYRQEGGVIASNSSQTVYMQQQEQRVLYGGAGPSRLQYLYTNQQQTPDTRFSYPDSRHAQFNGPSHFNYSPEQLASQRRHFAEQQRHNELQQQRLLGERMSSEGQGQQLRPGDGGGGGGGGGNQQHHMHPQQPPRQQPLELPSAHYSEQQRHHEQHKHHEQPQAGHYGETRQINENNVDNQRQTNEQQPQHSELKNHEPKKLTEQNDEATKPSNTKLDLVKPSSPEDDDEGGFVKRGAQSDSGRGSTVYSSVKAKPVTTTNTGEKGEEWSERVETELRQILSGSGGSSESLSSVSPPLPPLSPPASSGEERPKYTLNSNSLGLGGGFKPQNGPLWVSRPGEKNSRSHHKSSKSASNLLSSRLEIDSMLDENNSSDEELDYADTRLIRKQLEGLESMYGQVLKLLKARKQHGYDGIDSNLRHRRRTCGSVSSVPSSVSSRPIRTSRSQPRGKVRDFKGINKRFQRLESHVVTLARSVAHLSSEMRTQHLMMQEMEVMRGELAALRIQSNAQQQQQPSQHMLMNSIRLGQGNSTTPDKVKRLTKFFGDEPPLLRLFLRGLGYEKYASLFEKERIGLLELPYLTEDRLHKLGIPLGPRLRILQQAHLANPNTLAVL